MAPTVPGRGRFSWICRDQFERDRFLDMHHRMAPVHNKNLLILAVVLGPAVPWIRPLAVALIAVALISYGAVLRKATRFRRPEVVVAAGLFVALTLVAAGMVIDGSQHDGDLALLTWPVVAAGCRFPSRVVLMGTIYTAALVVVASLGFDPSAVFQEPLRLAIPLAVLFSVTLVSSTLRASDVKHRGAAIFDELTGMLNRTALTTRTSEIEHQSAVAGESVGVIVADIDHFKSVNDHYGHGIGDTVLKGTAVVLRKQLRAFDLVYRLGGEEFVIILLGGDVGDATRLAERLRSAIRDEPIGGLKITMSFGVAASGDQSPFVWKDVFERADSALYQAKRTGRDRVCREVPDDLPSASPQPRRESQAWETLSSAA